MQEPLKKMSLIKLQTDIVSVTDIGSVRENNEDFYGVSETSNGIVCVVCDGMGGHNGGEVASKIAVESIINSFKKKKYDDLKQALMDAFEIANTKIINVANNNSNLHGMGTTACTLLIQGNCAWIAHVGDSRIYLFSARKKHLHRLTKDHSLVQSLINQGIITEKEAINHPSKSKILKALGIKYDIEAEVLENPILPAKDDIFLLCTDGLYGEILDKEIEKILSKNISLQNKSDLLMQKVKTIGGRDNITFQLIKMSDSENKTSFFKTKICRKN